MKLNKILKESEIILDGGSRIELRNSILELVKEHMTEVHKTPVNYKQANKIAKLVLKKRIENVKEIY